MKHTTTTTLYETRRDTISQEGLCYLASYEVTKDEGSVATYAEADTTITVKLRLRSDEEADALASRLDKAVAEFFAESAPPSFRGRTKRGRTKRKEDLVTALDALFVMPITWQLVRNWTDTEVAEAEEWASAGVEQRINMATPPHVRVFLGGPRG